MTGEVISKLNLTKTSSNNVTSTAGAKPSASNGQHNSWLLRFFESKHFDMSISISYLFNTKEPGVQTYLCNRLFTFPNEEVDFYLPQLLNIYIYCCNETSEQLVADMLNAYFRTRCSCPFNGIDFSLRCSWLLDAHINDNARLVTSTKESRAKRGLNNAIKLYKMIISERLRPNNKPSYRRKSLKPTINENNTHSETKSLNGFKTDVEDNHKKYVFTCPRSVYLKYFIKTETDLN